MDQTKDIIVDDIGFVRKGCQFSTRPLFDTEMNGFIGKFDIYPFCKSLID